MNLAEKSEALGRTEDEIDVSEIYNDTIRVGTFIEETKTYDLTQHDEAITIAQLQVDEMEIILDTGKDLDGEELTDLELQLLQKNNFLQLVFLIHSKKKKQERMNLSIKMMQ